VSHVGSVALRLLADRVGLTDAVSKALTRRSFTPVHDRGRVLIDVAVLLADGGEAIADIDVLRDQSELFGSVASTSMRPMGFHRDEVFSSSRSSRLTGRRMRQRGNLRL
jgi:hypothetical protein